MTNFIKSISNQSWQRCVEKGTLIHCWRVSKEAAWFRLFEKTVWTFIKKVKIALPYFPTVLFIDFKLISPKVSGYKYMHIHVRFRAILPKCPTSDECIYATK